MVPAPSRVKRNVEMRTNTFTMSSKWYEIGTWLIVSSQRESKQLVHWEKDSRNIVYIGIPEIPSTSSLLVKQQYPHIRVHHHHISLISGLFPRSLALLPSMILMNVCLEGFQKGNWKQRAERTICPVKLEFQKYPYSFLDNEKRSACIA